MSSVDFHIKVLGRTLEHLGKQMYKRRDVAIAELVANCWDAGARHVWIEAPLPEKYDRAKSVISISDDGQGMTPKEVQETYLIVGRNRRASGGSESNGRRVMGRKGVGKLAGFGVADDMNVLTWRDGQSTHLKLDIATLTRDDGSSADVPIPGIIGPVSSDLSSASGTRIKLSRLKHPTPLDVDVVRESLGRRFSRSVRGEMQIFLNGVEIREPELDFEYEFPSSLTEQEHTLSSGATVKYSYGFTKLPIPSAQMRGFNILVNGKTAQAPPFFFFVEGTASGQHGTRYLSGTIEADFLDNGTDNNSDRISTDRQELDWEDPGVKELKEWGDQLTRKALRDWVQRRSRKIREAVEASPELMERINRMEEAAQIRIGKFLDLLGQTETDPGRSKELADSLIKAFEYQHFHDVTEMLDAAADDPERLYLLVTQLLEWKVLESRAILEIIKGRLDVVEKFHRMIVNDAAETGHRTGDDNLHDLLAWYPWLINPDWQVLNEEKTISAQLREWSVTELGPVDAGRYDFLALTDQRILIVIDIKRSGHAVDFTELQRLEAYKERLVRANRKIKMVMISGSGYNVSPDVTTNWEKRDDGDLLEWNEVYERTKRYYEHYRAVLEGASDHDDFGKKSREVLRTRHILEPGGSYRGKIARAAGLGEQDNSFTMTTSDVVGEHTPD